MAVQCDNPLLVNEIQHSLGVKTQIHTMGTKVYLKQLDLNENEIATLKFLTPNDKKILGRFEKKQKAAAIRVVTSMIYEDANRIRIHSIQFPQKTQKSFFTNNIYSLLKFIQNIHININYAPDYLPLQHHIETLHKPHHEFHKMFYTMYGINKKYNEHVYISDTKSLTMGDVIAQFGMPAQILFSGDGCETFLYVGLHICEQGGKKEYYHGLMVFHHNVYGKVTSFFYFIPRCNSCFSHVNMPICHLQLCN